MLRWPPGGGVIRPDERLTTIGRRQPPDVRPCTPFEAGNRRRDNVRQTNYSWSAPVRNCCIPGGLRGDSVGGGSPDDKPRNAEPYRPRSDNGAGDGHVLAIRPNAHARLREHQRTGRASCRQSHSPRNRRHERLLADVTVPVRRKSKNQSDHHLRRRGRSTIPPGKAVFTETASAGAATPCFPGSTTCFTSPSAVQSSGTGPIALAMH